MLSTMSEQINLFFSIKITSLQIRVWVAHWFYNLSDKQVFLQLLNGTFFFLKKKAQ